MSEDRMWRLSQVARKLNVGTNTVIQALEKKGFSIDSSPNAKLTQEQYDILAREFATSAHEKEEASGITIGKKHSDNVVINTNSPQESGSSDEEEEILIKNLSSKEQPKEEAAEEVEEPTTQTPKLQGIKVVGKIDLEPKKAPKKEEEPAPKAATPEPPKEEKKVVEEAPKAEAKVETPEPPAEVAEAPKAPKEELKEAPEKVAEEPPVLAKPEPIIKKEDRVIEAKADALKGLTVLGKIELPEAKKKQPVASSDDRDKKKKKRPRKRIVVEGKEGGDNSRFKKPEPGKPATAPAKGRFEKKEEVSDKEIQDKIKATLARLSKGSKPGQGANRSKYRRDKRSAKAEAEEEKMLQQQEDSKTLKVTEFISANDLASLMGVSVNDVISACLSMGIFVSINQRLDAETITVIADEFGFDIEFSTSEEESEAINTEDDIEDDEPRAPIVTIMGHVDHGKTSLLDYIRKTKVTAGEAGGITQHIGAYDVETSGGNKIAFLDTPGHEAFTAMRARGAALTDIAIIVVAADDNVMPQTKEAINHAKVAGVPIVIAINKVDKANANPNKIKEELSQINILVEDWGGKYQCQEISAKTGQGIDDLLEKVLLEAEILELKAKASKKAVGSVIEASLDKGRGYVATVMVQNGTLNIGDVVLAGSHFGKVKAMFDHRGTRLKQAGPSTPVLLLGLDGAPQAGEKLNVMESDREARDIAYKRQQIQREQNLRTKKHITLDEIGRRLAIGSFRELNVIVKGDVDGSIEALADSLLKLSTPEVQVNIIHKAVGQISESDVLLASASDAIIVGFQVRPSSSARRLAEQEEIEIRLYSIIYDAINEIKDAMEGMLAPEFQEVITGNVEIREVFKISKVGTVAGCMVTDGFIKRNNQIRIIRDGIVVYTGEIQQLRRFKDDVAEVKQGYECGISIKNFNNLEEGDIIEGFEQREVKRSL
ncbi:translation initiation factor IF-2 [Imperialibacter roseus]|uniref:Translation initiation factor IF-2 n=1 Tax=Imperialibacter roseus TaxID=1324217 RepID=A0ABZ0INQ1_9BACT|nr:translation initiation factor IF-2 [Imperialibacter roseus]WOK06663.1 translation initiation factor IF-2 [Imperialibacter roseus]